jgi:hypothetical protein
VSDASKPEDSPQPPLTAPPPQQPPPPPFDPDERLIVESKYTRNDDGNTIDL